MAGFWDRVQFLGKLQYQEYQGSCGLIASASFGRMADSKAAIHLANEREERGYLQNGMIFGVL